MKRIIRLFTLATSDALIRARGFGDEILHAIPPGRILCLGTVWKGQLAPEVQGVAAAVTSSFAASGLSIGGILHAEPAPGGLDLGRRWLGNLATKVLGAAADFASARGPAEVGAEPGTDVTEVLEQLDRLRRDMGTAEPARIADGARRLRDAAERVSSSLKDEEEHGAFSEGRRIADGLMPRRTIGDFSRPVPISTIHRRNREAAARNAAPTVIPQAECNGGPVPRSVPATPPARRRCVMQSTRCTPPQLRAIDSGP
jgi:hypothetical protein